MKRAVTFFFSALRTTTAVWTAAITQPTVRTAKNSAGTSSMTTRCPKSPPPPSSPRRPTSCSTPPCDGAVGHQEGTLHQGRRRSSLEVSFSFKNHSSEDLAHVVAG